MRGSLIHPPLHVSSNVSFGRRFHKTWDSNEVLVFEHGCSTAELHQIKSKRPFMILEVLLLDVIYSSAEAKE